MDKATMKKLLCLLLLLSTPLEASPKHFYNDKWWWIGEAVIVSEVGIDAHVTSVGIRRGFTEENPLLGGHPSNGAVVIWAAGMTTLYTTGHVFTWHYLHGESRIASDLLVPGIATAVHVPAIVKDYELLRQCNLALLRNCQ